MTDDAPAEEPFFDVLLVTAVSSEFEALKAAARSMRLGWKKRKSKVVRAYWELEHLRDERVAVLQLKSMGSFSASGSAFTCYRALRETRASSVVAVGIAFGVDEGEQQIGDVLISRQVMLYDEGTVRDATPPDPYIYDYGPDPALPATEHLVNRFATDKAASEGRPVRVGTFLAGGARIESKAFRHHLCDRVKAAVTDEVVGGEMESPGIAAACAAVPSTGWVAVKAISDFATAETRAAIETTRGIAAARAAEFVLRVLSRSLSNVTMPP